MRSLRKSQRGTPPVSQVNIPRVQISTPQQPMNDTQPSSAPELTRIEEQPISTSDIELVPTNIHEVTPVYPEPPSTRDTRPAIFNNDNCIMCGTVVCNMNIHAGFSLLIAFVLLISLGTWMALDPNLFNQLLPVASFLLGVIFPSPVFASMINRKPRSPEEYDKMVRVNARRRESFNV